MSKVNNKVRITIDLELPFDSTNWEGLAIRESIFKHLIVAAYYHNKESEMKLINPAEDNKTYRDEMIEFRKWSQVIRLCDWDWDFTDEETLPNEVRLSKLTNLENEIKELKARIAAH